MLLSSLLDKIPEKQTYCMENWDGKALRRLFDYFDVSG
jgi:hypothetical protein